MLDNILKIRIVPHIKKSFAMINFLRLTGYVKSKPIVLFLYSSIINIEISTASQTINIARISIVANVIVSNCTEGNPVNTNISSLIVKILDVNILNKKIIKLAANNPTK